MQRTTHAVSTTMFVVPSLCLFPSEPARAKHGKAYGASLPRVFEAYFEKAMPR